MKDRVSAGVLALFLGAFGAHKFYLGRSGVGVLYLLFCWTGIPSILGMIDGIRLLIMDPNEFNLLYNNGANLALPPQGQNIVVNVSNPTGSHGGKSVSEQLKGLHDLFVAGGITAEEYEREKKKVLG